MTSMGPFTTELTRSRITEAMQVAGLVAVIRVDDGAKLVNVCKALHDGGVICSEITMTSPGAVEAIAEANEALGDQCLIGVGSVLDTQMARQALDAGAQFVVSPVASPEVIDTAHQYDKPIIAGALTPTEILSAWQGGADLVKVFPAQHFGPRYLQDLLAPMPDLQLVPTGGVDLDTVGQWLAAGAVCLGVGSSLVRRNLISVGDWSGLADLARRYVDAVQRARADDG